MSRIRLLVIVILSLSTTNSVMINIDVTCPRDWVQHPSYKNACYRLGTTAGNYASATAGCEAFLNGSMVANVYNLEIHNFLADGLLSVDKEYYTGLTDVNGKYAFKELNNELLGTWNRWGTVTGGPCTVYANVGGEWVWNTNTCDQSCLYICEYIVPTPGKLPTVLIPVDSTIMSGRVEIFWNYMWGVLRDSEFLDTVTIICNDLGHSVIGGVECTGASCGNGKIWYERVSCNSGHANLSECLAAGAKLSTQTDHSKNTIVTCGDPLSTYQPTTEEHTTTAEATTETTISETTTAEHTTTPQNVVTTDPITPQNNFTVIYNVTTTVNITVTEIMTINITATVTYTSSPTCSYWSSSDVTSSGIPTTNEDPTTTTPRQEMPINDDPQPVIKAKNSAKYSTKTRQDHRPSAQAIGSFGVVIIAVILGAIVAIDVGTIGKEVKRCSRKKSSASKNRINEDNISIRSVSSRSFTNVSSYNPDRQLTS